MTFLALAHLRHRKLRSALSVLAVGVGTAMLVVMLSLSHGMLNEVADRMESVDAELIVLPENENVIFTAGAPFPGRVAGAIESFAMDGRRAVRRAIPVMTDTLQMGGQQQRLFGVDVRDMPAFLGERRLVEGRLFDEGRRYGNRLDGLRNPEGYYNALEISEAETAAAAELVIDSRLARVGGYRVGDEVIFLGRTFRVVGVVEAGVAGRVFCPLQVLQALKNNGMPWVSLFFVQLDIPPGAPNDFAERAADGLAAAIRAKVEVKSAYRALLFSSFRQVYLYINVASAVALTVCFLFILLVMYMMVLERTREIGILKSLGAGRGYLMRESIVEAVIVCGAGTLLGIALAFVTKFAVEAARPLLTLSIEPRFVGLAILIGVLGGTASALYPGYRAARLDPATALNFD